jgi:putative ABC transport system ATP-binding protein
MKIVLEGDRLAFISVKNLRKVYKIGNEKVYALKKIDLDIDRGEICCILGTSGSGKSTLLNMLAGLEKPTRGDIFINGVNVAKLSEKKLARFRQENTGFIFQSYNLISQFNALENVGMPLMFKGMARAKRDKLSAKMLKLVGLGARMKHRPNQMSGGQQQRVGIARAFVAKPNVVFADEPTGNLDTKTTDEVMRLMVRMCRKYNITLILVTHDLEIAGYADRIVHIIDGEITSIENNVSVYDPEEDNNGSEKDKNTEKSEVSV